ALRCSDGDPQTAFTFEELLIAAWNHDQNSWGLRGFEREHPDPERLHREVDNRGKGQKGLVDLGYIEKVRTRLYRLTPSGLARASQVDPSDTLTMEKANRALATEVKGILEHPVFIKWLKQQAPPKSFRDAGHFWGIAPGTPPKVIRDRVEAVERTIHAAQTLLLDLGVEKIGERHGTLLYEQEDLDRALEFQETLRKAFAQDLKLLLGGDI
ncbi:MAG: hypothetical protein ABR507_03160, partial [Actinomycetota bacterium]